MMFADGCAPGEDADTGASGTRDSTHCIADRAEDVAEIRCATGRGFLERDNVGPARASSRKEALRPVPPGFQPSRPLTGRSSVGTLSF